MSILTFSGTKLSFAALLCIGAISLSGCGGSRDEPFDPGDGDDNDDVDVVQVDIQSLTIGTDPILPEDDNKRLQVMTDEDEFYLVWDKYMTDGVDTPDFTRGQVILIDSGVINNNPCADKLTFRSATAQEENGTVVKVIIEYEDFEERTGGDCTDSMQATRPFRFMFVNSTKKLIFSEKMRWRSSSSRSSVSSSASSSSSSVSSSIPAI
ncbi:MAG: hypothetical protein WA987_15955 [Cellvibrio sp.]|jgi:hypothetical protein